MRHSTSFEKEFAGQDVVPLIFAVVDVQEGAGLWQSAQLESGTSSATIFAGQLAGAKLVLVRGRECEAALSRLGDGHFPAVRGLRWQERAYGRDSKQIEQRSAVDIWHARKYKQARNEQAIR